MKDGAERIALLSMSLGRMQRPMHSGYLNKQDRTIDCRRKPSGNMRRVPGLLQLIVSAMVDHNWVSMLGMLITQGKKPILWEKRNPMIGAFTICTATYGSGSRMIGTAIIVVLLMMNGPG